MAWRLPKGTDVGLQLSHAAPVENQSEIQPSIAFYFTDRPGTIHPAMLLLRSAGHGHSGRRKGLCGAFELHRGGGHGYSGGVAARPLSRKRFARRFATLPDGSRKWLIWIKDWELTQQSDFTFKQPVFIPKGSRIDMEYTFDNSADNLVQSVSTAEAREVRLAILG